MMGAELRGSDVLALIVGACNGYPEVTLVQETDVDVQVQVIAFSTSLARGLECQEVIEIQLQKPLGDRVVVDKQTGQPVSVTIVNLPADVAPPEIDDPPNDAELQDLQAVANQFGITLQEAIDRYAWRDNFSLAVTKIREAAPAAFAGAEIEDDGHAWVAFAGPAPDAALDIIDLFNSSQSGVSVEVRTGMEFTEEELEKAIPAAHYAVYEAPEVRDATTSFDSATGRITTTVMLESTASDSVLNDLRAAAVKAIIDATRADFLDSITYSVVRPNGPVGGLDE